FTQQTQLIIQQTLMSSRVYSQRRSARRQITLPHEPHLTLRKRSYNTVQHTMVIKQHQIALFPLMRVDILRADSRPLQAVHDLTHLRQIVDDASVLQVDASYGRRVDLQRQLARDGVLPCHGQDLDLVRVDGWELCLGQLAAFGVQAQSCRERAGPAHPDVRMRRVLDLAGADEFLVLV
ncbi:hypothetical protein T310_6879, partial [Rasamsonia emersonii CBS 393.64]